MCWACASGRTSWCASLVLSDPAPFVPFVLKKPRREVDYEAKAKSLAGRRYVVRLDLDEMTKDAANRAIIVANRGANQEGLEDPRSAKRATAASSPTRRVTAFPSTAPRSRRTQNSTACSRRRPMRISRRSTDARIQTTLATVERASA